MSGTNELLANNENYAANFKQGDLPLPPAKKTRNAKKSGLPISKVRSLTLSESRAIPCGSPP